MKSIFDPGTRREVISRIKCLGADSTAHWGKMNVYQMVQHCIRWEEMLQGKAIFKQSVLGWLFGRIALKNMLKDESIKPNLPTVPSFKMNGNGDVAAASAKWINLLQLHDGQQIDGFVHPFFGKLTAEQAGILDYKHIDHHLRQFGC